MGCPFGFVSDLNKFQKEKDELACVHVCVHHLLSAPSGTDLQDDTDCSPVAELRTGH